MTVDDDPRAERPARLATLTRAIPLGETLVIGTVGAPGARRALLRAPSGEIRTVSNGDMVMGGRVVKVDEAGLEVLRAGRLERHDLIQPEQMASSPRPRPDPRRSAEADGERRIRVPVWPGA